VSPSSLPSLAPSPYLPPTSSPTVLAVVPIIDFITIQGVTRNSIILSANLALGADTGGSLYCVAMSMSAVLSSVGAVKAAARGGSRYRGNFTPIPKGSTSAISANMTISGLDAVQRYRVYCYVEASSGKGNSLREVIQRNATATTACCKLVPFTNAPPYVYSVVSKYNTSSPALFVFSYTLPDIPIGTLYVDHVVYVVGSDRDNIVAVPPSLVFQGQSSLTGQFYLSSPPGATVKCDLSLSFTGAYGSNYTGDTVRVAVLSPTDREPPPKMVSCQFTDSGDSLSIRFDSPTDEAGLGDDSWACNTLFTFAGASSATCIWTDTKNVRVTFPVVTSFLSNAALLKPGSSVTLKGLLLRAFCTRSASSCSSNPTSILSTLFTSPPTNPITPTVVIAAPSTLGSCLNLTLDATESYGNGARLYSSVKWSVAALKSGSAVNVSSLERYLNRFSTLYQVQRPITILRSSLTSATYSITLSLRNYLGRISSTTVNIDILKDLTTPALGIVGASYQTIVPSTYLTINSASSQSGCASFTEPLQYNWTVEQNGLVSRMKSISPDPTTFSLLPYSLQVDQTYTLTLTASAGASSTSAAVTLYVLHGEVTAAVAGGYTRSVPVDRSFVLDASISRDTDLSPTEPSKLLYKVKLSKLILGYLI
jgi:REJ domain